MPRMPAYAAEPIRRSAEAVHLAALGLWCGILVTIGVMAGVTFKTMRELDATSPLYANYEGDAFLIVAGKVMNTAFLFGDYAGLAALFIALVTVVIIHAVSRHRPIGPATVLRWVALGMLIAITVFTAFVMRPAMNADLDAYWQAAERGDTATAQTHKQAFDKRHSRAAFLLSTQFALAGAAFLTGALAATGPSAREQRALDADRAKDEARRDTGSAGDADDSETQGPAS
jgi:hypothetical protein